MTKITQSYLRELFSYDAGTGVFIWRERPREHFNTSRACSAWNGRYPGKKAGSVSAEGYVYIKINGDSYRANRLAWLWMTGRWPIRLVDHADTNRQNDRWENLRLSTNVQNSQNQRRAKNNTSGFKGVDYQKRHKSAPWRARIAIDGRTVSLGAFKTPEDAHAAYCEAAKYNFGEFWRAS